MFTRFQQRVADTGSHYFDADTMKFFDSRHLAASELEVTPDVYLFVTSERTEYESDRRYTVRTAEFRPTTDVERARGTASEHVDIYDIGEFMAHRTAVRAKRAAKDARDDMLRRKTRNV